MAPSTDTTAATPPRRRETLAFRVHAAQGAPVIVSRIPTLDEDGRVVAPLQFALDVACPLAAELALDVGTTIDGFPEHVPLDDLSDELVQGAADHIEQLAMGLRDQPQETIDDMLQATAEAGGHVHVTLGDPSAAGAAASDDD